MKRFGLIGAAGYIAPRHMKAIKETGNELIVAMDPNDSVGILDSHFPDAHFFTEFERFDRHVDKIRRAGKGVECFTVCSPNYLHDSHIRFALRSGADAICEKPLVINPWNLDALREFEKESGHRVFNILQLRLHPSVIELKKKIDSSPADKKFDLNLSYITSRGRWYLASWKGDEAKSGGIATNIGIHFFDMLLWIFGRAQSIKVHHSDPMRMAGFMELERARVRWLLSVNSDDLPNEAKLKRQRTYRSILVDGVEAEFSDGFENLHTASYQHIFSGGGFGIEDARASIETVFEIRKAAPVGYHGDYHPHLKMIVGG